MQEMLEGVDVRGCAGLPSILLLNCLAKILVLKNSVNKKKCLS